MNRFKLLYILCLLLMISEEAYTQELSQQQIDSVFNDFSKDTPGISISLVNNKGSILRASYGSAQLEYDILVDSKTVFHIASDSKRFTAFTILLLESQGKLRLSDSIQTYLKDFPSFEHTITIAHLLQHTSGLRDQWQLLGMAGWRMEDIVTQEQILKVLYKQRELNFIPKSEFVYCNSGYTLLAEIVAVVSGQSFEEFTTKHIFEPLGMLDTHFHTDHQQLVKNRAYSYSGKNNSTYQKEILNFSNAGATGLFTTVEDLEKWLMNVMSPNPKVGSKAIFEKMSEQLVLDTGEKMIYGMGEMVFNIGGKTLIGHGGNDAGFNSFVGYYPNYNVGVIALSNWRNVSSGNLVIQLAETYLKDKAPNKKRQTIPKKEEKKQRTYVQPTEEQLKRQTGVYETVWGNVYVKSVDGELYFKNVGDDDIFKLYKAIDRERYYNEENDYTLIFSKKNKDVYTKLKVTGPNNTNFSAQRIYLADYSQKDLHQFTGTYKSEELETSYTLVVENGSLVAKHFRHSDIPLSLKSKDRFSGQVWYFDLVEFIRNEQGEITAMLVSGGRGRAKNVRFTKM